ncbi:hypothetical protein L519_5006 [Bordetella bronchiseptica MBORD678]|uniref:hypothetical protein n=1 Tax=Bordetella bronchiseptica TaxID=518 RepID=UPI00049F7A34|nr:hypothetical protein [Bordetella bronchiseptica]KAB1444016.1 hypothetical protein F7D00_21790 [Bordetella bronchiseptica]KAB1568799.1 hypothetical protein F7890_21790 [Bordetella bronchiseptica]KDD93750.1 hypothetical protein L519_5006 [Bordetella bronchiseptica MBORD678]
MTLAVLASWAIAGWQAPAVRASSMWKPTASRLQDGRRDYRSGLYPVDDPGPGFRKSAPFADGEVLQYATDRIRLTDLRQLRMRLRETPARNAG